MRHIANSGRDLIVDDEEVIVRVERKLGRIKRSFRQARSTGKLLGVSAPNKERRSSHCHAATQQVASGENAADRVHRTFSWLVTLIRFAKINRECHRDRARAAAR